MLVGKRLRLVPNKEQKKWLQSNAGAVRFIYNFSIAMKEDAYKEQGINIGQKEIMRQITDMKYTPEYAWLQSYNSETIKQAVKDMLRAYTSFLKRGIGFPKF